MEKRNRTLLFFFFVVLFFASIPAIVLYTQGYRIDFVNLVLVETGGMDLGIRPFSVKIFLNDELRQETNFFFRNALFRNIIPGDYAVRIEKKDYQDWSKIIIVEAGQVNRVSSIRLFSQALKERLVLENVEHITLSPDSRYALSLLSVVPEIETTKNQEVPQTTATAQLHMLTLRDGSTQPILDLSPREKIVRMEWADNSKTFLVHTKEKRNQKIYTASVEEPDLLFEWDVFLTKKYPGAYDTDAKIVASNTPNIFFVIARQVDGTFSLDRLNLTDQLVIRDVVTDITGFTTSDDAIFFIDSLAVLHQANMFTGELSTLNTTPIAEEELDTIRIIVRGDKKAIALLSNTNLTLWQEDKPLERIAQNVEGIAFSPDGNKFVYWGDAGIFVYWLREVFGPPKRLAGDTERIEEIQNTTRIRWLEGRSAHLIIEASDNKILIPELDARGGRNIIEFTLDNPLLAFDSGRQLIYSLKNSDLIALPLQ